MQPLKSFFSDRHTYIHTQGNHRHRSSNSILDINIFYLFLIGMVWMGLFMAPGLPAINLVKLAIIMYVRGWAVMTTNVPHETVFKAGSNNFYFVLLLIMLFLCTLPVSFELILE